MRFRPGRVFKFKKSLITILVIAAAAVITILIVKGLNAPAQGSLSQTPPSKAEKVVPYSQIGSYNGKYISFTYPPHFKIVPSKLSGSYIETVALSNTAMSGEQINIGVARGKISEDGSVNYRRIHPELYKYNQTLLWQDFTKIDGTEDTFFIPHDDLLASVSASSPNANMDGEAPFIANGLKWR